MNSESGAFNASDGLARHGVPSHIFGIIVRIELNLLDAELAVSHGLPSVDSEVGIKRDSTGKLKPNKEATSSATYKYKLQDPTHVRGLTRFESRLPSHGLGSCKLLLSQAALTRGKKATKMVSLAGPAILQLAPTSLRVVDVLVEALPWRSPSRTRRRRRAPASGARGGRGGEHLRAARGARGP